MRVSDGNSLDDFHSIWTTGSSETLCFEKFSFWYILVGNFKNLECSNICICAKNFKEVIFDVFIFQYNGALLILTICHEYLDLFHVHTSITTVLLAFHWPIYVYMGPFTATGACGRGHCTHNLHMVRVFSSIKDFLKQCNLTYIWCCHLSVNSRFKPTISP